MNRYYISVIAIMGIFLQSGRDVAASPGSLIVKGLSRYTASDAAGETAEKLTRELGEAMVERVAAKAVKEGGQESLERLSLLVAKYGPNIVRAMDQSASPSRLMDAFEELQPDQISKALARLAAGQQGRELAETTVRVGSSALKAEIAHPGIGGRIVQSLGADGARLCGKLSSNQAIALGRFADDIAQLPTSQRSQLMALIERDSDRFFQWLGRFLDQNPGKTIGSVTFMSVFLPNSERILGGDEIVYGDDGKPTVVTKPGVIGRAGEAVSRNVLAPVGGGLWVLFIGGAALCLVMTVLQAIRLTSLWRRGAGHPGPPRV